VVSVMISAMRKHNHVLPVLACMTWLFLATIAPVALLAPILLAGGFHVYVETMTQLSFRAPSLRKPAIDDPLWTSNRIYVGQHHLQSYVLNGKEGSPVVWICHGWTSGSERMLGRTEIFRKLGWHVVMFDLPSHGASSRLSKWTAEHSTTMLIQSANQLARQRPELFFGPVFFYGHSMGAFIGLRLSKRRDECVFGHQFSGWMFESPMTGYSEIFSETCDILHIPLVLRPVVLANTLRHVNALIGPERRITDLSDADVPRWGLPHEPTLLLQAHPDERLGLTHFERLTQALAENSANVALESHLINGLTHKGANVHNERDELVTEWSNKQVRYSSD
jgi:pimeloyl-ACP methyl ester carboxylesterase